MSKFAKIYILSRYTKLKFSFKQFVSKHISHKTILPILYSRIFLTFHFWFKNQKSDSCSIKSTEWLENWVIMDSFLFMKPSCLSFDSYHYIILFERSLFVPAGIFICIKDLCTARGSCFLILNDQWVFLWK